MSPFSFFRAVFLLPLFLGCSYYPTESIKNSESLPVAKRNSVSVTDVQEYAQIRASETKVNDVFSIEPIMNGQDTVLYLVNYSDGWELLSGDRRLERVLAFCDEGHLSEGDMYLNPVLSDWLDNNKEYISDLLSYADFQQTDGSFDTWNGLLSNPGDEWHEWYTEYLNPVTLQQNHLLSTKWGQDYPWNTKTPLNCDGDHCAAGCTMVAAGQVLYYLHNKLGVPSSSPKNGITYLQIPTPSDSLTIAPGYAMFDTPDSDTWDLMPLDSTSVTGYFDYVATLMLRLGYRLGATYHHASTGASFDLIPTVFGNDYGVYCQLAGIEHMINYSLSGSPAYVGPFNTIMNETYYREMPVIAGVRRGVPNNYHYHSIVIDGFRYITQTKRTHYVKRSTGETMYIDQEIRSMSVCINWGWDGSHQDSSSGSPNWYSISTFWAVGARQYNYLTDMVYGFDSL